MFGVFLAQKCFFRRYVPIYSKGLVNNRNTTIYFRMIEFITLILKHSCFTQYSKTMSKATRHKELGDDYLPSVPQPHADHKWDCLYEYPPQHQARLL